MEATEKGPHISMWIRSKQQSAIVVLLRKGKRLCLAWKQISHGETDLEILMKGKLLFIWFKTSKEACPRRLCQILQTGGPVTFAKQELKIQLAIGVETIVLYPTVICIKN